MLPFIAMKSVARPFEIEFKLLYKGQTVVPGVHDPSQRENDSIHISTFRFYLSSVELHGQGKILWKEPDSFHLIDASDLTTTGIMLDVPETGPANQLFFQLGIDSITNVSGAFGGPLDPVKGMYWSWQSGYINVKLEGSCGRCATRNHEFQYHLGGYRYPDNSLQRIQMKINDQNHIVIGIELAAFFSSFDMAEMPHIMSPGKESVHLSALLASCFKGHDQ